MPERRHERTPFEGRDRRQGDRRQHDRRKSDKIGNLLKYVLVGVIVAALVKWLGI